MPRNKEGGEFTLIVPLDASRIKDFKPDCAVEVAAHGPKGFAYETTVNLDARAQGKAAL